MAKSVADICAQCVLSECDFTRNGCLLKKGRAAYLRNQNAGQPTPADVRLAASAWNRQYKIELRADQSEATA